MTKFTVCLMMAVSVVSLLAGCAGGPTAIPDATTADARLYAEKCGSCHAVPHPGRNTAKEWTHLFSLMEKRMAERQIPAFSAEERRVLQSYLQAHAR